MSEEIQAAMARNAAGGAPLPLLRPDDLADYLRAYGDLAMLFDRLPIGRHDLVLPSDVVPAA